jgi:hypothetical protein
MKKNLSILALLIWLQPAMSQNAGVKGTIFELLGRKENDSVYKKWMDGYTVTKNSGSFNEYSLIGAPKGKKKARYNVKLNIYNGSIAAVTVMNFGKKSFFGQYKELLPFDLQWGDDWEVIEKQKRFTGIKGDNGVRGTHGGYKFLLGFDSIISSKYELTEEGRRLLLVMKKLNRITLNNAYGPEYMNAL